MDYLFTNILCSSNHPDKPEENICLGKLLAAFPNTVELKQYLGVFLCGEYVNNYEDNTLPDNWPKFRNSHKTLLFCSVNDGIIITD